MNSTKVQKRSKLVQLTRMKYKKLKQRLEVGQLWFDKLPNKEKAERTRPGSPKWR